MPGWAYALISNFLVWQKSVTRCEIIDLGMNKRTRILVVDDDPDLLENLALLLRREGYEVFEAATGQQGLNLAHEKQPDLVLLDVLLPDIRGTEICRQIKTDASLLDVFVILFSGEATSAAQKAQGLDSGADEYIAKPVIAEELMARIRTMMRLRQTTLALRASEQHYRSLVEILPDAVGLIDLEGRLTAINAHAVAMLGYDNQSELLEKDIFELIPAEFSERVRADLATVVQTGVIRNRETILLRKNGERITVEASAASLQGARGQPYGIVGILRDSTERKRAEVVLRASEERFRQLAESIREVFWMTDCTKNEMLYVSPGYEEVWGRSCDSLYASPWSWMQGIHLEERTRVLQAALAKQISGQYEEVYRIVRPDGSIRWIKDRAFPIRDDSGQVYRLAGIAEDITIQKRAEDALRESEARKSAVMEAALDAIITLDHQGVIVEFNAAAEKTFGCSRSQAVGKEMAVILIPTFLREWFRGGLARSFAGDTGPILGSRIEIIVLRADGTELPAEFTIARVDLPGPAVFTAFIRDISSRKRSESKLATLAHAVESTAEMICITDLQDRFTFVNGAFQKAYGYTESEILGNKRELLFSPRNPASLPGEILRKTRSGGWQGEVLDRRKDGTEFPVQLSTSEIKDTAGRILGLMGVGQDITERKRAEEQIRLLADAVQSTQEMISITDPENRFIFVNQAFLATYGCSEAEVIGRSPDFLYSMNNPSGLCEHIFKQTVSGGWCGELMNRRIDGTEFPISLSTSRIKNSAGKILGLVGVARDITERKRSERQSTAFALLGYRLSAAAAPEQAANNILTIASDLFGWDSGYVHLYSQKDNKILPILTIDTVGGKRIPIADTSFEHDPSPLMTLVMNQGARLVNREQGIPDPINLLPFGDTQRPSASMMYVPIHSGGSVLGILSIQSYTPKAYSEDDLKLLQTLADHCGEALQRIKVAGALREAEAKYRSIFENATEGIFQTTPEGRYLSANPALARMFGYQTPEELISEVSDIERQTYVHPKRREELKQLLETQGAVRGFKAERYRKDGSRFWISINGHVVRAASGAIRYYEGTNQDITERELAQAVLRESEEKFRTLFESSPIGGALHDSFGRYITTNQAYQRMLGYTHQELRRLSARLVTHPEDIREGQRLFVELREGKRERYQREKRYLHKDGHIVWAQSSASAVRNNTGELINIISMVVDITERKTVEAALHDSERKLRLIAKNTTDVIFAFDMDRQPLYANPAVKELTGYSFAEIQHRKFINWIHPDDREQMLKRWEDLYCGKEYSDLEFRLITKTGQTKWCSSTWGPLFDEQGQQIGIQGRERDITERKVAEAELRGVPRRIIDAQEAERQRVARELHDGVNQIIASAKMRLCKVEAAIPALNPAAREILGRCEHLLVRALEENRRIAHNLRPSELDELGLATACRNFCREVQTRTRLKFRCRISRGEQRWPREVELNLFRIVQEAITNIEKHARAHTAQLQIALQGETIVLRIKDDGRGFSPAAARSEKRKGHGIGLTNIRERALSLGATCEVKTVLKQGTTIIVRVPLRM
jgi:PAS domain S-box-containing protein